RRRPLGGRDQPSSVVDLFGARCEDAMDNINLRGRDRALAAIPKLSRAVRLALATVSVRVGIWWVDWLYTQRATLQQEARPSVSQFIGFAGAHCHRVGSQVFGSQHTALYPRTRLDDFLQVDNTKSGFGGWNDLDLAYREPLYGFYSFNLLCERRNLLCTLGLWQQDKFWSGGDHGCEIHHSEAGEDVHPYCRNDSTRACPRKQIRRHFSRRLFRLLRREVL